MQISPNLHFQVIVQVDLWPWFVTFWPHEHMEIPISYQYTKCGSNRTSIFQVRPFSHFQPNFHNFTLDDLWLWYMTFDHVNIWRSPYYINKQSLGPIRLQLFKWGHSSIFSLSYNLWRFPYVINDPSLIQIRLQLFKWGHFHIFSLILTTWL